MIFFIEQAFYQKIQTSPGVYDLVFPSDYMVEKMRKEGLLEKLERIWSVKTDIVHVGICTEIIDEQTHKKVLCPKIQEIVDFLQKNNIKVVFGTHK